MKIQYFHGSPGAPQDFKRVSQAVGDRFAHEAHARAGYPGAKAVSTEESRLAVGYSWGCADALLEVARNPDGVCGILLVAPYLFPERGTSPLKKVLLSLPVVGDALLKKAGPKVIDGLVTHSCAPCEIPAAYREDARRYLDPAVLRRAALEKDIPGEVLLDALSLLKSRGIPVAIVRGKDDHTSKEELQIQPLLKAADLAFDECLPGAGHALLWTHAGEVARAISRLIELSEVGNGAK